MIDRKFATPFLAVLLLTLSTISLSGCGKKEKPPEPSSPVVSLSQPSVPAPAPAAAEAAMPAERAAGSSAGTAANAEAVMKKSDCFTCHAVDKKIIGPAYSWVAYRYKDDKEAITKLVVKVKKGGMGEWNAYTGAAAMTPHAQFSDDEIKAMVEWVLSQTPVEPPKA